MIVKSLSRRGGTAQLITYVLRETKQKQKLSRNDIAKLSQEFSDGKFKIIFQRDYVTTRSKVVEEALADARRLAKTHEFAKVVAEKEMFNPVKAKGTRFFISKNHIILRRSGVDTLYAVESPHLKALGRPERQKAKEHVQIVLKHNISAHGTKGYIDAFEQNELNRIHKRTNAVVLRHSVISFSPLDREKVQQRMFEDISRKFIELHGKESLYLAILHEDRSHPHLHILQSGTTISGVSNRVSRNQFQHIKVKLQEYQEEKFPELVHSIALHSRGRGEARGREGEKIKRNERTESNKIMLEQMLETSYQKARSVEDFVARIEASGLSVYYRNNLLQGVKLNDTKFRLSRLGFDQKRIVSLDLLEEKEKTDLRELQDIRQTHKRSKARAIGVVEGNEEKIIETVEESKEQIEYSENIDEVTLEEEADLENDDEFKEELEDEAEQEQEIDDELSDLDFEE